MVEQEAGGCAECVPAGKKLKKPSMSFGTSFSLSLKNLFTKKGRTMLTSFAGSIGIIGIALVLSISQGFNTYINTIQEETLSSYPLTIQKTNTDFSALMETFMGSATSDSEHDNNAVYKKSAIYDMMDALNNMETSENDLKSFKSYIETQRKDSESDLHKAVNGVQYSYDLDLLVYTKNVDNTIIYSDTEELMQEMVMEHMGVDMQAMTNASNSVFGENATSMMSSMGMGGSSMNLWQELLPGDNGKPINDLLKKQYDVVYGSWPNSYDEIVLVLDENNELDDMTLYALGLEPKDSGFVMGEGAAIVVLEELEHAKARGAKIYAEVAGYGTSSDAYHITSPAEDGAGAARAMTNAVEDAGIRPEEVTYINAHGTSTHHNDLFETRAIKLAFGDHAYDMKVNSTKSMVGHLLGAAGAIEFVTCVKEMQDNFVHATVGYTTPDEELDLDYCKEAVQMDVPYALSNSLGFGGHNASILLKKYSE